VSIGLTVGSITDEIGTQSFLHAFFSTVSVHCEPQGWGSRFPHLMNELYQGRLPTGSAKAALAELREAKAVLERLPPTNLVWDVENRSAQPPWGKNIASTITSLGNYFVTSTGRDLFGVLEEALIASVDEKKDTVIG
jgi:hypothetical protein